MSLNKCQLQSRKRFRATAKVFSLSFLVFVLAATAMAQGAQRSNSDSQENDQDESKFAIGLWGDLPYSDVQALTGIPNLIADMNAQELAFTVHDGDLKAGNGTPGSVTPTTCVDALYTQALGFFNSLKAPAVFTTGDNDWTDCDRPSNGGFSSLERLDHERALFFSTPFSLGQRRMLMEVQATPLCLGVSGPVP